MHHSHDDLLDITKSFISIQLHNSFKNVYIVKENTFLKYLFSPLRLNSLLLNKPQPALQMQIRHCGSLAHLHEDCEGRVLIDVHTTQIIFIT